MLIFQESKPNFVVRFMRGPYYKAVTHKIARWFILLGFVILFALMVYSASRLEVNEEQVCFLVMLLFQVNGKCPQSCKKIVGLHFQTFYIHRALINSLVILIVLYRIKK